MTSAAPAAQPVLATRGLSLAFEARAIPKSEHAARSFRSDDIFAGIFVLGALGFLTNSLMQRLEAYLLRWRPVHSGG